MSVVERRYSWLPSCRRYDEPLSVSLLNSSFARDSIPLRIHVIANFKVFTVLINYRSLRLIMAHILPTCIVSWPSTPLTSALVINSLKCLRTPVTITSSAQGAASTGDHHLIQWSTYDEIDHELTHLHRQKVLSSSYTFRKALIRKHFLSRCILSYVTKHPTSPLKSASPKTFEVEISFADELDEMWTDELWDLGEELETTRSWWILKPSVKSPVYTPLASSNLLEPQWNGRSRNRHQAIQYKGDLATDL